MLRYGDTGLCCGLAGSERVVGLCWLVGACTHHARGAAGMQGTGLSMLHLLLLWLWLAMRLLLRLAGAPSGVA